MHFLTVLFVLVTLVFQSTAQSIPECGRYVEGSESYDVLRRPYNMAISPNESQPKVIWLACSEDSVLQALREAVETKAEISVRSGGHNVEGYSTYAPAGSLKPRILIDVYHLKTKMFQNPHATFGAGIKVIEANEFLAKQNPVVAVPFTECGTVGITGSALGGGFGKLARKYGLTTDNIVSMRVALIQSNVPAVVDVNATSNPDLFWALRGGGGGNFGVVTQITFNTHLFPPTVTTFKADAPLAAVRQLAEFIITVAPELTFTMIVNEPGPNASLALDGVYLGDMPATMEAQLNRLASDANATTKLIFHRFKPEESRDWGRPMNFCGNEENCLEQARNVPYVDKKYFKRKAIFLNSIDEAVRAMKLLKTEVTGDIGWVELTSFDGQIATVKPTDTAFVHRTDLILLNAPFLLWLFKFWDKDTPDAEPLHAGMKRFHEKVRAITGRNASGYPNFIDRDHLSEDWMAIFYGENAARLKTVKALYDPQNYFQFPMSIPITHNSSDGPAPVPAHTVPIAQGSSEGTTSIPVSPTLVAQNISEASTPEHAPTIPISQNSSDGPTSVHAPTVPTAPNISDGSTPVDAPTIPISQNSSEGSTPVPGPTIPVTENTVPAVSVSVTPNNTDSSNTCTCTCNCLITPSVPKSNL